MPTLAKATGTWREVQKDQQPALEEMFTEFIEPRNGWLRRGEPMWERQVFTGDTYDGVNPGPSLLAVYEEKGEAQGYIAWAPKWIHASPSDAGGPGQRIYVRDYVYKTPSAYRAMWEYLKNFDLASRIVFDAAPTDDPAFHVLQDPRELHATHRDWMHGRILDLERLLPLRPYSAEGRVVFDVRGRDVPLERRPLGARGRPGRLDRHAHEGVTVAVARYLGAGADLLRAGVADERRALRPRGGVAGCRPQALGRDVAHRLRAVLQ